MEKYRIISTNLEEHFHDVAVRAALAYGEKNDANFKDEDIITEADFLNMANQGIKILRSKERKIHDSFAGSIFCMGILDDYPDRNFVLAEPENDSYDLAILMSEKNQSPISTVKNTDFFRTQTVIKLEITELVDLSEQSILYLVENKLGPKHDYKGRVLLINIDTTGQIDFVKMSELFKSKNTNFKTIRLLARASLTENKYILVELLKEKVLIKQFEVHIDVKKMFDRVRALSKQP